MAHRMIRNHNPLIRNPTCYLLHDGPASVQSKLNIFPLYTAKKKKRIL